MLGAVAGAQGDLGAQHERHGVAAAEHVPGLADLVEHLVGGDPHEVRVHELDNRAETAVEGDAAGQPREGVLADRRAQHAAGKLVGKPWWRRWCRRSAGGRPHRGRRCAGPSSIRRSMTLGHGVDELPRVSLPVKSLCSPCARPQFGQIAADANVDEGGVWPQRRTDGASPGLPAGSCSTSAATASLMASARLLADRRDARSSISPRLVISAATRSRGSRARHAASSSLVR